MSTFLPQERPMSAFARRHIGPDPDDQRRMLDTIGYGSIDELMDAAIPEVIRWHGPLELPRGRRARRRRSPSCARSPRRTGRWCR